MGYTWRSKPFADSQAIAVFVDKALKQDAEFKIEKDEKGLYIEIEVGDEDEMMQLDYLQSIEKEEA